MTKILPVLALAALALTGCGSDSTNPILPSAPATPPVTPPPMPMPTVMTLAQLVASLIRGGTCENSLPIGIDSLELMASEVLVTDVDAISTGCST